MDKQTRIDIQRKLVAGRTLIDWQTWTVLTQLRGADAMERASRILDSIGHPGAIRDVTNYAYYRAAKLEPEYRVAVGIRVPRAAGADGLHRVAQAMRRA